MQQVRLELDSNVRRSSNGTALMGGSPFRLIRLSAAGSQLLNDWLTGTATPASGEATKLRDRLIRGGMVHPVFSPVPTNSPEVTSAFVVPVHNDVRRSRSATGSVAFVLARQPGRRGGRRIR